MDINDTKVNTIINNKNVEIPKFKLRSPIHYNIEDLLSCFSILLILIIIVFFWYLFTKLFIYIAYHKITERLEDLPDTEDENEYSF